MGLFTRLFKKNNQSKSPNKVGARYEKSELQMVQKVFREASQAADSRKDFEAYKLYKSIDSNPKWQIYLTPKIKFSLYLNLGLVSKRLENYSEAINWYNVCYECATTIEEYLMVVKSRGKILYITGQKKEAVADYKEIMVKYYQQLQRQNKKEDEVLSILIETQIPYHMGASQVDELVFAKEYRKSLLGLPSNINDDKAHEVLFFALDQIIELGKKDSKDTK